MEAAWEPFATGELEVGDGHILYYEEVGNPDGSPIVYLHGGPGSGCTFGTRRHFDPQRHCAVLFDQRASGRSRPHGSDDHVNWAAIDLDHHIADIEALRETIGVDRWAVFGISWGSVLGVAYAQRHPGHVTAVVVAAVSTGTAEDIDWLTVGARRFFPDEWRAFEDHVPPRLRHQRLVDAYNELVMDNDPAVHQPAARAWCDWEDHHVATTPGAGHDPRYDDPRFRLGFARQVTHCWRHSSWLADDELVANAHLLSGVPGTLIHGRLDVSSPLLGPWRLHKAWAGSALIVVEKPRPCWCNASSSSVVIRLEALGHSPSRCCSPQKASHAEGVGQRTRQPAGNGRHASSSPTPPYKPPCRGSAQSGCPDLPAHVWVASG